MDNYNYEKSFTDENQWQSLSQPVYNHENLNIDQVVSNEHIQRKLRKHKCISPVISFQLIICLAFLAFIYLCRVAMPSLFSMTMDLYDEQLNTSVYFSGDINDLDFSRILSATDDEI